MKDSPTPPTSKSLEETIQNAMEGTKGTYGIVVKNLKTGENYVLSDRKKFNSASLYKLWIMAETYGQIKKGVLREDDILSEDVEVLNEKFRIGTESAELKEGTITSSVSEALQKMTTVSDNYSALLLTQKIRLSKVKAFLTQNGFDESSVGTDGSDPQTTAYDIALFFEKLYKGELADNEYTGKMFSLLKDQRLNNKIPRDLPKNTVIAHKTGELDEYTHDAGIVYGKKGDYIIVVLSKSTDPDLAENRISNVSSAVYSYFENPL